MNSYPADEQRIAEVERGRSCHAILPLAPGQSVRAGDSIIFALALSQPNQEPCFVSNGDSVRVVLTDVTDLGSTDPATGLALFHLSWLPLGQVEPTKTPARRPRKVRPSPIGRDGAAGILVPSGSSGL